MPAEVLFAGDVHVDYGQIYVHCLTDGTGDMGECFRGQVNGLCGAAVPDMLFLMTGTHTGHVGFTVELHGDEPPLDDEWEEAVEASFRIGGAECCLAEWGGDWYPLDIPEGDYRVRYCARGMAEARGDWVEDDEPPLDHYLLQLWPAPPAGDRILRQTTADAAYWHDWARGLPPPPTPEELAEQARREQLKQERLAAERRAEADRRRWGDRVPNDRLRAVRGHVKSMEWIDMALVFALSEADEATQRAIARWAAEKAYAAAGLADLPWVAPALAAMREGRPLPPPFDDLNAIPPHLDRVPITAVPSHDGKQHRISQQHAALPAIYHALEPDSLQAALDSLYAVVLTHGTGYDVVLRDVRRAFPELA